jgi:hypothetical protein
MGTIMNIFPATTPRRIRAVRLSALALAILSPTFAAATIGPKLVLQGVQQQTSNTLSSNSVDEGTCPDSTRCYVLFPKIPANTQLIVSHVSCYVNLTWISTEGDVVLVTLYPHRTGAGDVLRSQMLVPVRTAESNYVVSGDMQQLLVTNDFPVVKIFTIFEGNFAEATCTLTGAVYTTP